MQFLKTKCVRATCFFSRCNARAYFASDIIKKAIQMDRTGEAILEHLVCLPEQDIQVLVLPKLKETMAIAAWYLCFEHNVEVVTALQNYSSSSVATAVFDDSYFMSLDFNHVIFVHCNRESNQVAHELFVAAANGKIIICFDSFTTEAIAARFGMNLA